MPGVKLINKVVTYFQQKGRGLQDFIYMVHVQSSYTNVHKSIHNVIVILKVSVVMVSTV